MKNNKIRRLLSEILSVVWAVSFAFMAWKALCIATGAAYPILVVTSESMAPAFHRGDLILLWNRVEKIHTGDIPVVWFSGNPLPMVHRAIKVTYEEQSDGLARQLILTKGDNNPLDDVVMYPPGRSSVYREEILGLVCGYVPGIGWASLMGRSSPWIMYTGVSLMLAMGMLG